MNSPTMQASRRWSYGRRVLMTLALVSLTSSLCISPAFAQKDKGHGRGNPHGSQGQRQGDHDQRYEYRPQYPQYGYGYAQPVYVPTPVYYAPQPSLGISLLFPLDVRHY